MYKINSIFNSLQGEGFWTGTSLIFIRFSGCNLKCGWCDTKHEKTNIIYGQAELLIHDLHKYYPNCKRVCLTGGEPMLQVDYYLIKGLAFDNYKVHIETNGTIKKDFGYIIAPDWWVTVSPKEDWILRKGNELKVIWNGQTKEMLSRYFESCFDHYYLQPQYPWIRIPGYDEDRDRMNTLINIIKEEPRWRLSLQIQKLLGVR